MKEKKVKAIHSIFGLEENKIYEVEDEKRDFYLVSLEYTKVYLAKNLFKKVS